MKLSQLIDGLGLSGPAGDVEVDVSALAYDSRRVVPGALFFCVPGEQSDGHAFAADAIAAGATALIVERPLGLGVPEVHVADARAAMAPIAARFNGHPSKELTVAAVTGTNGKTTTAWLLREILEATLGPCGMIGTVTRVLGGEEQPAARTTPEAIDLQADFRQMLDAGDRCCVIEASSHAMTLHRCDATEFAAATFTNLTQDHLDFHRDMDDYFLAKRRLFELAPGAGIFNVDDEYGRRLAAEFGGITYSGAGVATADLRAERVEFDAAGTRFRLNGGGTAAIGQSLPEEGLEVRIGLPGYFNVANALAAVASAARLGIAVEEAIAALAGASRVPGRFEPVDRGQDFTVLVDYAHTPDSLDNVLSAARKLTTGRVISVFGAGGDRDRGKRPKMGLAGSKASDLVFVTSDNPRSERPEDIVSEVLAGAKEGGAEVEVVIDRRQAIATALAEARSGDVVVIAGKGHEQGQEFEKGRKVPFDDRETASRLLDDLVASGREAA